MRVPRVSKPRERLLGESPIKRQHGDFRSCRVRSNPAREVQGQCTRTEPAGRSATFSFWARNSFDDRGDIAGASRGGLASLNRPTKKSERQLVRRADPRSCLISAAFDGKPSYSGRVDESRSAPATRWQVQQVRLPGLTGMVEGCFTWRDAEPRRPQKLSYARSACIQHAVGPGGSTQRVHTFAPACTGSADPATRQPAGRMQCPPNVLETSP